MRIFLPAIEVGDLEGFLPEKDIFARADLGKGLTNLVGSVSEPMVLAVDGQWGSGKTVFLKMWAGELRKANFPVVYLDAFQHDYAEDAFTAVAGEIIALANSKKPKELTRAFRQKAIGAGKVLLRSSAKLAMKTATLGVLDAADFEKVATDVAKEASDLTDRYLGELFTKQKQQKETLQAFRDALVELPSLLKDANAEGDAKPLIIIVDELDRCRPVFALEVLERIKHFFSVKNVHFVLGAHLGQIGNSVKVAYGTEMNADLYLQKLIQLTVFLTEDIGRQDQWAATKFFDYVVGQLDFKPEHRQVINDARGFILHVVHDRNLSLRTIERVMTNLALSLSFLGNATLSGPLLSGLCILKVMHPELFVRAKMGVLYFNEVREKLSLYATAGEGEEHTVYHARMIWMYCLSEPAGNDDAIKHEYEQIKRHYRANGPGLLSSYANGVIDRLRPYH